MNGWLDRIRSAVLHELLGRRLPVPTVKRINLDARQVKALDAAQINHPSAWGNPWAAEETDAAFFAEVVLGRHGAELVETKVGLAGQDTQVRIVGAVPYGSFHAADRTVALNGRASEAVKLEGDVATVARAFMGLHAKILNCGPTLESSRGIAVSSGERLGYTPV